MYNKRIKARCRDFRRIRSSFAQAGVKNTRPVSFVTTKSPPLPNRKTGDRYQKLYNGNCRLCLNGASCRSVKQRAVLHAGHKAGSASIPGCTRFRRAFWEKLPASR